MSNLAVGALIGGLALATVIDVKSRRIPNWVTAAMAGVGLALAITGTSGTSVAASFAGFVLGFLLMLPGYRLGATGAGDVKLMAAVGAIVGPALVVTAFLFTAVAGGVLAIAVAARRNRLAATVAQAGALVAAPGDAPQQIRTAGASHRFAYGPAIAAGSMLAVLLA